VDASPNRISPSVAHAVRHRLGTLELTAAINQHARPFAPGIGKDFRLLRRSADTALIRGGLTRPHTQA
jgi:hypothetical protein